MLIIPAAVHSSEDSLLLTLNDAIRMAVEKNLDLRAELYNPAQFEADININRSIYNPLLILQASYTDSDVAPGTLSSSPGNTLALNSSLKQLLWTGGSAEIKFNNWHSDTPSSSWQTGLGASISQPLLKNVGREATEIAINISRFSKFASLERFNSRLLTTVAQVRTEYFKLYSLREEREVKKVSLELARKILFETQSRVKAGVLPAMEVLNAEFGAVTREKDLIDAERAVSDQVDVLRLLLQINAKVSDLKTVDMPTRDQVVPVENDAIQKALNRPDIREQKRNLELFEIQTKNLSQKTRPDLTLTASAQLTGLDNAYQKNMDKVLTFDYPVWNVGINLSYPLGNGSAENDYRKSRLKTEQASLQLRSLEESSTKEVKAAIRGVVVGYKQIEVADRGKVFAEERLRAFMRKNEVGLATTKDVLDVENDLAVSKSNQIKAVVDYAKALTTYWQVTGELLEREGVRVVEGDADKLYSATR
ncbi:MAG: TolC family protein [Geobacteraceae bacterium]|nr:TolC family protein [Geobacteraceae bacterium]NTW79460.1 TolC family protein [Geobacteraceae bacterium]